MGQGLLAAIGTCTLVFSVPGAYADCYLTGNELYRGCQGSIADQSLCLGYVMGVFDEWDAVRLRLGAHRPKCLPVEFRMMKFGMS